MFTLTQSINVITLQLNCGSSACMPQYSWSTEQQCLNTTSEATRRTSRSISGQDQANPRRYVKRSCFGPSPPKSTDITKRTDSVTFAITRLHSCQDQRDHPTGTVDCRQLTHDTVQVSHSNRSRRHCVTYLQYFSVAGFFFFLASRGSVMH
jgi:hypothetical protein